MQLEKTSNSLAKRAQINNKNKFDRALEFQAKVFFIKTQSH